MKKILKILLIISIITLMFCVAGTYAKNNEQQDTAKWNVSDGLKLTKDLSDTQDYYKDGEYFTFRIIWGNDSELSKYKDGFIKDGNGMYTYDFVDATQYNNSYGVYSTIAYGEYVKIGDKTYWVEASQDITSIANGNDKVSDYKNFDNEKLMGYLTYFNEHNNATIVDL